MTRLESNKELVSIILTVFNKDKFISKTIDGVFQQTYKNYELIIINDCSTDNSKSKILKKIKNKKKIFYYENKINKGVSYSRNLGFLKSKGKYICFLDGDDFYYKNFLFTSINKLKLNNSDIVHCSWKRVNENYEFISNYVAPDPQDYKEELLFGNIFAPSSLMFRREVILNVGKFKDNYETAEDWEFLVRCAINNFKFSRIKSYNMLYMEHTLSRRKNENSNDKRFFLEINDIFKNKKLPEKYINLKKLVILRHRFFLYLDYKKWKNIELKIYNQKKILDLLVNIKIPNRYLKYFIPLLKSFDFLDLLKVLFLLFKHSNINILYVYNFLINKFCKIIK